MSGTSFSSLVAKLDNKFGKGYLPIGTLVDPDLDNSKKFPIITLEDLLALKQKGKVTD